MSIDISRTLFVGDLSVFCTETELRQLFQPFGYIDDIRLKKTTANATRLGYGFIQFGTKECAERAMNSLNGIMFNGRIMRINWAVPKSATKMLVIKPPKKVEAAQVHVSFISRQIEQIVTEATLRNLFNLYGEVIDVTFKKLQIDQNQKVQHGYGFVHYPLTKEGVSAALIAVKAFHQVTIDKVTYDCSMSSVLEDFLGLPTTTKQEAVQQPPQPPQPVQQMNSFPSTFFPSHHPQQQQQQQQQHQQVQSFPFQQFPQQMQQVHSLHQQQQQHHQFPPQISLPQPQQPQQQQQLADSFFPMLSKSTMSNNSLNNSSFYSQTSGHSNSYCNSYQTSANNSFYIPTERPASFKMDNIDTIHANSSFYSHSGKSSTPASSANHSASHTPMAMSNQLFASYSSSVSDCSNDSFLSNPNDFWESSFNSHSSVRDFLLSEE